MKNSLGLKEVRRQTELYHFSTTIHPNQLDHPELMRLFNPKAEA